MLKSIRISKKLTQQQAADMLGISLRSYISYENDSTKTNTLKYRYIIDTLNNYVTLDEEHGILTLKEIQDECVKVFDEYPIKYAILFGSYAKGTAKESSDIDLLISTEVTGLRFFGIAERLRTKLKKKIDLLDLKQINNNPLLLDEVLKDGIRIYEHNEK